MHHRSEQAQVDQLSHRVEDLLAAIEVLTRRVADLESDELRSADVVVGHDRAGTPTRSAPPLPEPQRWDRRRLLIGGASAIGAIAMVGAEAVPAAAANGDGLTLGNADNSATAPTGLSVNGTNDAYGFGVTDNGYSGTIDDKPTALFTAGNGNFGTAVSAIGQNGAIGAHITGGGVVGLLSLNPALLVSGGGDNGVAKAAAIRAIGTFYGVTASGADAGLRAVIDNTSSGLVVDRGGSTASPTKPGIKVDVRASGASPTNAASGIEVDSASGVGVQATSIAGYGVYGRSTSGYGTAGRSESSYGVVGVAKTGFAGVYGLSEDNTGAGVYGKSDGANGSGVLGGSVAGQAVRGTSSSGYGVYGVSNTGQGVCGVSNTVEGVAGKSTANAGVYGRSTNYYGVAGRGDNNHGVVGVNAAGAFAGVFGLSESGTSTGVLGQSATGSAVRGDATGAGIGVVGTSSGAAAAQFTADKAQLWLTPKTPSRPAPTADGSAHLRGEILSDGNGDLWFCTTPGTPGTWRKLAGPGTAGAFHLLPVPARVYDSRTGAPQGPKSQLAAGAARVLDLTVGGSGVPAGSTAAMVTLLLVNCATGDGNFTIWANGAAKPAANNMVWGGSAKRYSSLSVTGLDAAARCQVVSSLKTDFVLDVIGYYR